MTKRLDLIMERKVDIKLAALRNKAISIALFGSVARGEDTNESDFDFLVEFSPEASLFDQAGLQIELEELLGCKVDVISQGGLKPKDSQILREAVYL
jgi:predicted nucleotidyltransferase